MNPNPFYYTNFFEKLGIFEDFFKKYEYPWETLLHIKDFISDFSKTNNLGFTQIRENIFVGENVTIDSTARIEGMAILGHNATVGYGAYLRKGVILGENVHIGHAVEVKNSIIGNDTHIAHLNYVGDSVVGGNCTISGGSIIANTRLDRSEVTIKHEGERISTHLVKMGSIIGDGCFIGANTVLNPGTVLAKDCKVFPLTSVVGTYLTSQKIK